MLTMLGPRVCSKKEGGGGMVKNSKSCGAVQPAPFRTRINDDLTAVAQVL